MQHKWCVEELHGAAAVCALVAVNEGLLMVKRGSADDKLLPPQGPRVSQI